MSPERWQQVKDLLDRALELAPGEREAYVRAHSAGDHELCEEVVSLLVSHQEAGDFLEPVTAPVAEAPQPEGATDLAGTRIGAYQIVREVGRGGMGAVYLAVRADQEFRKRVAIKLIRHGEADHFAVSRFRNERQILARLEHANIARLIDGGTTAGGDPYFVMEFVEGESFLAYCHSHDVPLRKRIAIFQSVCAAVEYAHRRNIIHRDLKPTNILVKEDGTPKLLDFGIAKFVRDENGEENHSTLTGSPMMTPAYASPEQLRGQPATARSDIYSLGVVLWEMLTGELPRGERYLEAFDPERAGMAPDDGACLLRVAEVIRGAIRENPAERYASVEGFAKDVQTAVESSSAAAGPAVEFAEVSGEAPPNSVAVLPFRHFAPEGHSEAYLGAAIADAVIIRLSNVGRIVVRSTGSVMRFSPMADPVTAGRQLKVRFVLEGRIQKSGARIRVTIQLIAVESGAPVCAASFDEGADDLLQLEDSISAQVANALLPQLSREERRDLARQGTSSAEAHQAYLRGRWHWNRHSEDELPQVLMCFSEAVVDDPQYARAHAGLADYHLALGIRGVLPPAEAFDAAIDSARRAIGLDPRLAEAHASLGLALWARNRDFQAAEEHIQTAITLHPDYAPAHDWIGLVRLARGKPQLALLSIEHARSLEPANPIFGADLAMCYYTMRRYAEAIACFDVAEAPPAVISGSTLPLSLLAANDAAAALDAARRYAAATNRAPLSLGVLALAEAAAGNPGEAETLLAELARRARDFYVSGVALALANLACGRTREINRQLRRAIDEADWWGMYLPVMPVWDSVRESAAFNRTVKRTQAAAVKRRSWRLIAAAAVMAIAEAVFLYTRFFTAPAPFRDAGMTRLTTDGISDSAVISDDGRLAAWSQRNAGQTTIWLSVLESGERRQMAGPFDGIVFSLAFGRGAQDVVFGVRPVNDPLGAVLHFVPVGAGRQQAAIAGVASPLATAPDESRVAFYRFSGDTDQLVVADIDGAHGKLGAGRVIYSQRHPDVFSAHVPPVWSPDGRTLACLSQGGSFASRGDELLLVGMNGAVRKIDGTAWREIASVAWTRGGSGLMIAGRAPQESSRQIWYVPAGGGAPTRVTNDLDDYSFLSASSDATAMLAVQAQTVANVYILDPRGTDGPRQITPGAGHYSDVAWTPSGGVVYASDGAKSAELWAIDAAGRERRPLTRGPGRSAAPAVSPDGSTVAFQSDRDGVWNIWTVDSRGGEPVRVTHDSSESAWPQFTPDGAALVYQHLGSNALYSIRKQVLAGGPPEQLTTAHTMYPAVSADGRVAYWYCQNPSDPRWAIAVLAPGGSVPERFFVFPPDRMPRELLRWTPGGPAVSYVENLLGVSNIWIQPLTGPARQVTSFTSGHIYSFDWSRDGRLAYSQGVTASNIVLFRARK